MLKNKLDIIILPALLILIIAAVYANAAARVPHAMIILYMAGSAMYAMFTEFNMADRVFSADHVQTGEASLGIFSIYLCARFISLDLLVIFIAQSILLFIAGGVLRLITDTGRDESYVLGGIINVIIAISLVFAVHNGEQSGGAAIAETIWGYAHAHGPSFQRAALFLVLLVPMFAALRLISPEIMLHSHGSYYSSLYGNRKIAMTAAILATRSVLLSGTMLTLGILGCGAFYLRDNLKSDRAFLHTLLAIMLCVNLLLLLEAFIPRLWIALGIFAFSYMLFVQYKMKRKYIYDRG